MTNYSHCGDAAHTTNWVTRPDIEFFNSLCPVSEPNFPLPDADAVEQALHRGFRRMVEKHHAEIFDRIILLNKSELKVLVAIERKTFKFHKISEKMPRRMFTIGQINPQTGTYHINHAGAPTLLPTGINDRNLDRSIKGLLEKGMITKLRSDPHPIFGPSSIYSPIRLDIGVRRIFEYARDFLDDSGTSDDIENLDQLATTADNFLINILQS